MMETKRCLWMALLLLMLCACADRGETVAADGSTSMELVIGALGEAFEMKHSDVRVTFNPTGSGAGIRAVLDGRCDIGLSSRALKDAELASGLTATVLAYDGIAMIVHPDNLIDDLRVEEIGAIFTGEVTDWSEVGGAAGEIVCIGREAGSGTREGFEAAIGRRCQYRQELTSTGDVVTTVAQNPNAIGYASLASVRDSVKIVAVNGTMPTEDAIRDGSYGIRRPFLLVTRAGEQLSASAQKFFDFAAAPEAAEIIANAGAVAANMKGQAA